jgi:predicted neutral ceramidase superfamily lipid hydrolase
MQLIFDVDPHWFVLFFAFLGAWALLMISRKRSGKISNVKEQFYLAVAGLFSMVMMELFAVILWPTYVAAILFGYQLLRFIEERVVVKFVGMR